jgi:hypothetical protein
VSKRFDTSERTLQQDGAFIAALVDSTDVRMHAVWWVHYDKCNKHPRPEFMGHPKQYWYEGRVINITEDHFAVQLTHAEATYAYAYANTESANMIRRVSLTSMTSSALAPISVQLNTSTPPVSAQILSGTSENRYTFPEEEITGIHPTASLSVHDSHTHMSVAPTNISSMGSHTHINNTDDHLETGEYFDKTISLGETATHHRRNSLTGGVEQNALIWMPFGAGTKSSKELLQQALKNLRCIDWENISENLLEVSVREAGKQSFYHLSRNVLSGEKIDFFISHSWSDDGEQGKRKFIRLKEVAESYRQKTGKYPTFWFDKVCLDQTSLMEGLKVLPVNVMACKHMLVLFGNTYTNRLWCIW